MLPTFLIVGAQKSGTTSLVHALAAHPDVVVHTDELHFFDRHFERGVGWYEACFVPKAGRRPVAVGESSPEYLFDEAAPGRIAATLPEARLLAILRNPIDRAYSHYWHNRTRGHETLSFADALAAESQRLRSTDPRQRERYAYLARGTYATQLDRLCSHVGRERVHVFVAERLWSRPEEGMARLQAAIGVGPLVGGEALARVRNPFIEFRSQRLRQPIRRLPYPLRPLAARLNARRATYPPLDESVRADLRRVVAPANAALRAWLGDDVLEWDDAGPP